MIDLQNGIDIYLIDFGLARRYCQTVNNEYEHVKQVKLHSFTGTARYASITAQQQFTTSRKDDLESLAYIMVYFLKGRLPWQQVGKVAPNGLTAKQRKERLVKKSFYKVHFSFACIDYFIFATNLTKPIALVLQNPGDKNVNKGVRHMRRHTK